jgi:hypothetical protein
MSTGGGVAAGLEAQEVMERPTVAMARARMMAFMFFRMLWVSMMMF